MLEVDFCWLDKDDLLKIIKNIKDLHLLVELGVF